MAATGVPRKPRSSTWLPGGSEGSSESGWGVGVGPGFVGSSGGGDDGRGGVSSDTFVGSKVCSQEDSSVDVNKTCEKSR